MKVKFIRYIFPPEMEYYHRKDWKGMVSKMENGHGKVWICLLILVLIAVVIGLLYYTTAAKQPDEEGFLIRSEQIKSGEPGSGKLQSGEPGVGELRSEKLRSAQTGNGGNGYGI